MAQARVEPVRRPRHPPDLGRAVRGKKGQEGIPGIPAPRHQPDGLTCRQREARRDADPGGPYLFGVARKVLEVGPLRPIGVGEMDIEKLKP